MEQCEDLQGGTSIAERRKARNEALAKHRAKMKKLKPELFSDKHMDELGKHTATAVSKFCSTGRYSKSIHETLSMNPDEPGVCIAKGREKSEHVNIEAVLQNLRLTFQRPQLVPGMVQCEEEDDDNKEESCSQDNQENMLSRRNIPKESPQMEKKEDPLVPRTVGFEEQWDGLEEIDIEGNETLGGRLNCASDLPSTTHFDNYCLDLAEEEEEQTSLYSPTRLLS